MSPKKNNKKSRKTPDKDVPLERGDIKIKKHTFDDWEIELFIPLDHITEDILPKKLKHVKELLSTKYNIPQHLLQYQNIIQKEIVDDGVLTHLRIKRVSLEKGKPKFSFQTGISPSGIPYADMACYADLFQLDEFEKELTVERVKMLLKMEEIVEELIDEDTILKAIKELKETAKPVFGVRVAQGRFPDSGMDAEVQFYFHANPSIENSAEYISSRKVKRNDLLCDKNSPTEGKSGGLSVRGRSIPARRGFDIILQPVKNVRTDMEAKKLFAEIEGLVIVRREERAFMTPAGEKLVPSKILVRIDPLKIIELEDDEVIDVTTRESVEIRGNLKMGSRIISSGEVHISGSVGKDTVIHAADDLFVSGNILKGLLSSDKNIVADGRVEASTIAATDRVIVKGAAVSSDIVGKDIRIDEIYGGNITAGTSLTVNVLGEDEAGISATICVATKDFLQSKIDENREFIDAAQINLKKLKKLFGENMVKEVIPQNVQQMLMKYMSGLKKQGHANFSQMQVDIYKKLLTSIEPIRRLIYEKEIEIIRLQRQIRQSSLDKKMVVVKEQVKAKTKITIDNKTGFVLPKRGPITLSNRKSDSS